jgi:hypothetical protein
MPELSAIPIRTPWIEMILNGTKTWEIRTKFTKKLGPVALVKSGSGTVVAVAKISEVITLTESIAKKNSKKMGMTVASAVSCANCYASVLSDIVPLKKPVQYKHPSGAVTWVTLDETTSAKVLAEAKRTVS